MPPIPPPIPGSFFSGASTTMHSVVVNNDATPDASTNAVRTTFRGIIDNNPARALDGASDDVNAELLVKVDCHERVERRGGLEQGGATAWDDTLLDSGAGRIEGVHEPVLLLADLNLRRTADLDDGHTAAQLGEALLELFLLVIRHARVCDGTAELLASLRDQVLAAGAVEQDGILLGDGDRTGGTEQVEVGLLELDVELIGEHGAAR
ncbi:hypothetical protein BC938DRAFT_481795 [Jimgerdemannia flammicorona]|uniref:Uncharacterized protein n=1 Tax=Jimgerdemannia flammicorona TaxID=994334 RepID=A0A433QFI2_9FUNG|nr:hypothetical protein BC938DRAFT_481795 [Jimgerdemannia flammicorona]